MIKRMKKSKIISLIIFSALVLIVILITNTNMVISRYSSMENLLKFNSEFRFAKIEEILESDGVYLVIYEKDGIRTRYVFNSQGKYYTYRTLKFKDIIPIQKYNYTIRQMTCFGKTQILIESFDVGEKDKPICVSDNLYSDFQEEFVKFSINNNGTKYFFVSLDELPENYEITIDGETIPIKFN